MIYLITYNKALLRNYTPLENTIKQCSLAWWHHLDNTWLIETNLNLNQIYQRLSGCIQPQDRLLIIEISNQADYEGYLPQEAWNWMNQKMLKRY